MSQSMVPIAITMPPALAHRARMQAAAEDKSRSQFVREAVELALAARREGQIVTQHNQNHTEVQYATSQ